MNKRIFVFIAIAFSFALVTMLHLQAKDSEILSILRAEIQTFSPDLKYLASVNIFDEYTILYQSSNDVLTICSYSFTTNKYESRIAFDVVDSQGLSLVDKQSLKTTTSGDLCQDMKSSVGDVSRRCFGSNLPLKKGHGRVMSVIINATIDSNNPRVASVQIVWP